MSFHEDAKTLALQAVAKERSEEEARKEDERRAREGDIEKGRAACESVIIDWMAGIGMIPRPEISFKDLGLHDHYPDSGGAPTGKERWIGASWVFDAHYYRAEYKTEYSRLDSIEIRVADERGGLSWSHVRSPHKDQSIAKDKVEIGKVLLKENTIRAQRTRDF